MLRKGVGSEKAKANLKRVQDKAPDRGRGAKITNKNINLNYVGVRTAALPDTVKLEVSDDVSVQEQLKDILTKHGVKLIDLFREWDDVYATGYRKQGPCRAPCASTSSLSRAL